MNQRIEFATNQAFFAWVQWAAANGMAYTAREDSMGGFIVTVTGV